jgi:uncharacterized protein
MQTNGTLITEEHIRMFRQYGVQVGISLDGPGELKMMCAGTAIWRRPANRLPKQSGQFSACVKRYASQPHHHPA